MNLIQLKYQEACRKAKDLSAIHGCVQHVNAVLDVDNEGTPCVEGFTVSDWSDGTTMKSYSDGEES